MARLVLPTGGFFKPPLGTGIKWGHPLAFRLKAAWGFLGGGGGPLIDSTGFGNEGAITGNAAWKPGRGGVTFEFDGSSYYNLGDLLDLGLNSLTVACWLRTTDTEWGLISKTANASVTDRWAIVSTGGTVFCTLHGAAAVNATFSNSLLADGKWHHFALVIDRPANMTAYIDGVMVVASNISGQAARDVQSTFPLLIGTYANAAGTGVDTAFNFSGQIETLFLWHRALSARELQGHMLQPYGLYQQPRSLFVNTVSGFQPAWARGTNRLIGSGVGTGG